MAASDFVSVQAKLLLVAPSAYPLGGVATWLDYLVPELRGHGWTSDVALTAGKFHDVDRYLREHSLPSIVRVPFGSGTRESRVAELTKVIDLSQPDLVAFVNIPEALLAADRSRNKGTWSGRAVMIVHGIEPEPITDMKPLKTSLDAVICTNQLACALAVEAGTIERDRIFYAPCGIRVPTEMRQRTTAHGKIRIGYVGRVEQHQKRVLDLVELVRELRLREVEFELLIAGGGPEESSLRARLAAIDDGSITFCGSVPHNQLAAGVYSQLDVVLIPSLWETGPLVAWEAMAASVPVISSRFLGSGLEGRLRHDENCLMYPIGDMAAAADCVKILCDPVHRERIMTAGYWYAREHCTQEHSGAKFHEAFAATLLLPPLPTKRPSLDQVLQHPAGRLDRLFGVRAGEYLRRVLKRPAVHSEPGGEWPHTISNTQSNTGEYWELAARLDGLSMPVSCAPPVARVQ